MCDMMKSSGIGVLDETEMDSDNFLCDIGSSILWVQK